MLHRIHQKLGTTGFVIAIVALVAALGGTALAASGALSGKQKKEVEKIAKKFAGKPGATGAAGPAGTNGTNGKDGAAGTNGTNGKSVTITEIAEGVAECEELGGAKVEEEGVPASAAEVCNGQTGFTSTLPSEKTETGVWSLNAAVESSAVSLPLSFNIPLAAPLTGEKVHYVTKAEVTGHTAPAACPGNVVEPSAKPGNMCVYEDFALNVATGGLAIRNPTVFPPAVGAAQSGAEISVNVEAGAPRVAFGSWAVTAP